MVELRRAINQSTAIASNMIQLAGVPLIVSGDLRELIAGRAKWFPIGPDFNLLANFFWLEIPGLQKEASGRVDQAIGVYDEYKCSAWRRTFWLFYWFRFIADSFAQATVDFLAKLGFEAAKDTESQGGNILRVSLRVLGYILQAVLFALLALLKGWFWSLFGFK